MVNGMQYTTDSLLARRVLDVAVHRDAALFDLLALGAHKVLDRAVLAVLCDFLVELAGAALIGAEGWVETQSSVGARSGYVGG